MSPTAQNGKSEPPSGRRLMLLTTTTGYQTRQFADAAQRIGLSVVFGSDRCHRLEDPWQDGALPLKFEKPSEAAARLVEYARALPFHGIVALGDCCPSAAARAALELGLPFHSPQAADTCRDKYLSRRRLAEAGLPVPAFARYPLDAEPRALMRSGAPVAGFPCVLKPLALSASRGVIRADNAAEFAAAFERIRALLRSPEVRVSRQSSNDFIQAEKYIEGAELAIEAIVERGRLKILALFDKPDPLDGPYFAETIYVTPSRLDPAVQRQVGGTLARAVEALGLCHGPLHAEARVNAAGVWLLEVAARPIGGLCSRALRFRSPDLGGNISLEELLIRLSLGESVQEIERESTASGVMMIPVLEEGVFEKVEGLDEAREVPGIEEIVVTARRAERLVRWPEGSGYPGFIFARGASPDAVEESLRRAYARLRFVLAPALPVL